MASDYILWVEKFLEKKKQTLSYGGFSSWFNSFITPSFNIMEVTPLQGEVVVTDLGIGAMWNVNHWIYVPHDLIGVQATAANLASYKLMISQIDTPLSDVLHCVYWKLIVGWTTPHICCMPCHSSVQGHTEYEEYSRRVNGFVFRVCHSVAQLCLKPKPKPLFSIDFSMLVSEKCVPDRCEECEEYLRDCRCD